MCGCLFWFGFNVSTKENVNFDDDDIRTDGAVLAVLAATAT